jgi:hypothetical protein
MEDGIVDFLVRHYVANDLKFYGEARTEVLMRYPTLESQEILALDPKLKEARDALDLWCTQSKLTELEKKYFTPHGPPSSKDEQPFYYVFCIEISESLGRIVSQEKVDLKDELAMISAWKRALVEAADVPSLCSSRTGKEKITALFKQSECFCLAKDAPEPLAEFFRIGTQKELAYLIRVYDEAKSHE